MHAAVLCPGPSLVRWPHFNGYDLLIGVNRAPHIVHPATRVEWWAFTDWRIFLEHPLCYCPPVFTCTEARNVIERRGQGGRLTTHGFTLYEQLWPAFPMEWAWHRYSATAAIVLAAHLEAKHIDVFGADWTRDAADPDGVKVNGVKRDDERWRDEGALWDTVCLNLGLRGVTVKRRFPE